MHQRFNERKATQLAARFLELRGGTMHYIKLIKLMYFADREALLKWGRSISTDKFFSMDNGPILSTTLNLVTDGASEPAQNSYWSNSISAPHGDFEVSLLQAPGRGQLSAAELRLIDDVFQRYGFQNRWDLVKYSHTLPEWINPDGGSIPIEVRNVLKGAGKSEAEIATVQADLDELVLADILFQH